MKPKCVRTVANSLHFPSRHWVEASRTRVTPSAYRLELKLTGSAAVAAIIGPCHTGCSPRTAWQTIGSCHVSVGDIPIATGTPECDAYSAHWYATAPVS